MDKLIRKTGIITKGVGGLYGVRLMCRDGESTNLACRARGRFRTEGITPLPGDDVTVITENGEAEPVIDEILPRRSTLIRPPMANLTHLFLLLPSARPAPDLVTADKLAAIAEAASVETVVVAGKCDMDPESAEKISEIYTLAGYRTFKVSAVSGEGTGELLDFISAEAEKGVASGVPMRAAFAGVSGAGKSTLMSALFKGLKLKTGSVSRKTERGRHTTREVELFPLKADGGAEFFLADTPGFSMVDFTRFNFFPADELAGNFREFADCLGLCRYTKCTHTKEEGCAVLMKLSHGKIHKARHESYLQIYTELKQKPEWKRRKELQKK